MRHTTALVVMGAALALAGCAKNKVELVYEEPVTKTWTGAEAPPAQEQPQPSPAGPAQQALPAPGAPAYAPPGGYPPAAATMPPAGGAQPVPQGGMAAPANPQAFPQQHPQYPAAAQAQPAPPPGAWRNAQPAGPPPTNFPDPSVTTVVVPDQNPTTQTTLKRRTGWVRGGYD